MSGRFASATATGEPAALAARCIAGLTPVDQANFGLIYVTEPVASALPALLRDLSAHTGVNSWVGGVGLGVCSAESEIFEEPAAVVITAALPENGFRVFAATKDPGSDLPRRHAAWIEKSRPALALVHAVEDFSPIDSLSTGRAISWSELGAAFGQIVLLFGGVISAIGISLFTRRELATAQGNQ